MLTANFIAVDQDLAANDVHLWHAHLRLPDAELARLHRLLNEQEQQRASRFKVPAAREQFVASHGFLRLLLAQYLGTAPEDLQFATGEHGKPMLASSLNLKFNLSHTDGMAAVAISLQHEIGVDVERIRSDINVFELANRFFSSAEAEWLRAQPETEQTRAFYLCWTAKEAYIKACGTGLSMPLDRFSLIPSAVPQKKLTLQTSDDPSEPDRWSIWQIGMLPEFCCAIAVQAPEATVQVKKWEWNYSVNMGR